MKSNFFSFSPQQLGRAEDLELLRLYRQAQINDNQELGNLIQMEVTRRIKFDLLGSVEVYNAFMLANTFNQAA